MPKTAQNTSATRDSARKARTRVANTVSTKTDSAPKKKSTANTHTLTTAATKTYRKDGTFVAVPRGPSAGTFLYVGGKPIKFAPPIKLHGFVVDMNGCNPGIKTTIINNLGNASKIIVPLDVSQSPKSLLTFLTKNGAALTCGPNDKEAQVLRVYFATKVPNVTEIQSLGDGWCNLPDSSSAYVLNSKIYGPNASKYNMAVLSSENNQATKGEISSWIRITDTLKHDGIAVVGLLAGLASALLKPLNRPPIILVFVGKSSTGKSTVLKFVNTSFTAPSNIATWEATENGLEAAVAHHRHKPFVIDEIGQGDGKLFSNAAYRLTNSSPKLRANYTGDLIQGPPSSSNVITAGELSPMDLIKAAGKVVTDGQRARMLPIRIDEEFGIWSNIDGFNSGADKSKYIATELEDCYGIAAPLYCKYVAENVESLAEDFKQFADGYRLRVMGQIETSNMDAVANRVLDSFLLFGFAGRLANKAGIVNWNKKQTLGAVERGFSLWFSEYKQSLPISNEKILNNLRLFFQSKRGTMFKKLSQFDDAHQGTVAGYEHTLRGNPVFLVFPAYFENKLCEGVEKREVIQLLTTQKLLNLGTRKTPTKQIHIPGQSNLNVSFYVISRNILLS